MSEEISAEAPSITKSSRDADETGRRLAAWLREVLPDGADPIVEQVTVPEANGMSSETLLFRCSPATTWSCSSG
jgi:hypothetical protein